VSGCGWIAGPVAGLWPCRVHGRLLHTIGDVWCTWFGQNPLGGRIVMTFSWWVGLSQQIKYNNQLGYGWSWETYKYRWGGTKQSRWNITINFLFHPRARDRGGANQIWMQMRWYITISQTNKQTNDEWMIEQMKIRWYITISRTNEQQTNDEQWTTNDEQWATNNALMTNKQQTNEWHTTNERTTNERMTYDEWTIDERD